MIHDEITDVLLRARIPASTKGFIYIHDALEIMDKNQLSRISGVKTVKV